MQIMVPEWLQHLLILQDRDARCDGILRQLEDIPRKIEKEEANIQALDEAQEALQQDLKELEVKRLDLEGEVELCQEHILKYKTQQMQVKKNEEYTALEHEIEILNNRISELEDEEIQLLEDTDQKEKTVEDSRKSGLKEQQVLETHMARLKENYESFANELDAAREAVRECEEKIDPATLKQYYYVKSQVKRSPVVVSVENGRCEGCHLKVSGEVETDVRRGSMLVRCDNCGRILYFDRG